jgi:hypothetical protein
VARWILNGVVTFSEWHVGWRLDDLRARVLRMLEVSIDIFDGDEYVLAHLVRLRRPKRAALSAEHDGTFANRKLRVADDAVASEPETFGKTERSA